MSPRNGVGDVIVISGVLLVVAVVFLIIGLFGPLAWVYASIGVSVLSFAFLLLGVRQRRGVAPAVAPAGTGSTLATAPTAAAAPAGRGDEDVTLVAPNAPAPRGTLSASEPAATDATSTLRRPAGAATVAPADAGNSEPATVLTPAKKTTSRTPARKTAATTSSTAKKTAASRSTTAKSTAATKKTTPAKAAPAKSAPAKTAAKTAPAKTAANKTAAKATPAKTAPAKTATKKTTAAKKTTTVRKTTPRKTTS
jgi:hypothetical protein